MKKLFAIRYSLFASFLDDETAQSHVEYVLIAAFLLLAGYGAIKLFKDALASSFKKTASVRSGPAGMGP
ncbi:MAG: hypothetical protein WC947_03740 [Elusimicrobiota bacterium]